MVDAVAADSGLALCDVPCVAPQDMHTLLHTFQPKLLPDMYNGPSIHQAVEAHAAKNPKLAAVIMDDEEISYQEVCVP